VIENLKLTLESLNSVALLESLDPVLDSIYSKIFTRYSKITIITQARLEDKTIKTALLVDVFCSQQLIGCRQLKQMKDIL